MRASRRSEGEGDGARRALKAERTGACGAADAERALQRGAGRKQGKGGAAGPHGGAGPIPGAGLTPGEETSGPGKNVGLRDKMREEFFLFSFQSQTNFQTNSSIDSNILSYSFKNGKFC